MKKIAVLYSGMPRTFRRCYQSHLNFFSLDGYQFDFFFHLWSNNTYKRSAEVDKEDIEVLRKDITDIYSPKKIKIEEQVGSYYGIPQIYSWQQSCKLKTEYQKESNEVYDFSIKFRPDIVIKGLSENEKRMKFEMLGRHHLLFRWATLENGKTRVGDMMFGGQSKEMDTLLDNVYDFHKYKIKTESPSKVLGEKVRHDRLTADTNWDIDLFLYRKYHINTENQSYDSLHSQWLKEEYK